jgi:hypothetical protein
MIGGDSHSFMHPIAIVTGAVLALAGTLGVLLVTHTTLNVVSMTRAFQESWSRRTNPENRSSVPN